MREDQDKISGRGRRIAEGLAHLELAGGAEAGALVDLQLEGGVHLVVCMADNCGAPATDIVNVLVSVDIPAVGILDALEDDGLAAN